MTEQKKELTKQFVEYNVVNKTNTDNVDHTVRIAFYHEFYKNDIKRPERLVYLDSRPLDLINGEDFAVFEHETLWYEDHEYIMTNDNVYLKTDKNDLIDLEILYPLICFSILEPKGTQAKKTHCSIKFKVAGVKSDPDKPYTNKSRFSMCSSPSNEIFTYDAKGSTPKHQDKGWGTEQDSRKKNHLSNILSRSLNIAPAFEGYPSVGWKVKRVTRKNLITGQTEVVIKELEHITPNHHLYIGNNSEYLACQGSREIWKEQQENLIDNSPLYALGTGFSYGALTKGMFEIHPQLTNTFLIYGPPNMGKTSIAIGLLSNFTNTEMGFTSGLSSFVGLEGELYEKNNFCVFMEEYDDFYADDARKAIAQQVNLANGGGRKISSSSGKNSSKAFFSSVFATGNDSLNTILDRTKDTELKGAALQGRVLQRPINCPYLHTFIKKPLLDDNGMIITDDHGDTAYNIDVNNAITLLKENYGWGYISAIEFLKRTKDNWKTMYQEKIKEYEKKELFVGMEQKERVLSSLAFIFLGCEIVREVISEKAYNKCISALTIYEEILINESKSKSPEKKDKEYLVDFLRNIVYSPSNVYWSSYAFDIDSMNEAGERKKRSQKERATYLNNTNSNKKIAIKQLRPFNNSFDFDCEILISEHTFFINGQKFQKEKLEKVAETLGLYKVEKNGASKTKVVKTVKYFREGEAEFFNHDASSVTRIIVNLKELLKDDKDLMELLQHADINTIENEPVVVNRELPPVVSHKAKEEYSADEALKKMNAFFE